MRYTAPSNFLFLLPFISTIAVAAPVPLNADATHLTTICGHQHSESTLPLLNHHEKLIKRSSDGSESTTTTTTNMTGTFGIRQKQPSPLADPSARKYPGEKHNGSRAHDGFGEKCNGAGTNVRPGQRKEMNNMKKQKGLMKTVEELEDEGEIDRVPMGFEHGLEKRDAQCPGGCCGKKGKGRGKCTETGGSEDNASKLVKRSPEAQCPNGTCCGGRGGKKTSKGKGAYNGKRALEDITNIPRPIQPPVSQLEKRGAQCPGGCCGGKKGKGKGKKTLEPRVLEDITNVPRPVYPPGPVRTHGKRTIEERTLGDITNTPRPVHPPQPVYGESH